MITENLSTLKIHKLTQEQYNREAANGRIDENALYLTPDDSIRSLNDLGITATATELNCCDGVSSNIQEQLNHKAHAAHTHSYGQLNPACIELTGASGNGGYIDFHFNMSADDFTSRIIETSSGTVELNGGKIMTGKDIVAIYNASVTFSSGVAKYTNSNIKSNSIVIAQSRIGSANGAPVILGTTSYAGYVDIYSSSASEGVARNVNLIIVNP